MIRTETRVLKVDSQEPEPRVIEEAARVIKAGGLVVVPTDTVYGLVCDPGQPAAVDLIYSVKRRPRDLPLALLLHDMAQVSDCVSDIPEKAVRAMQEFWPGPLTIIVGNCKAITAPVCAGREGVGLRLPAHMVPRLVAGTAGIALASTSANISGRAAPRTAAEVMEQLNGLVSLVLDGGPAPLGRESTVLSFLTDPPEVLREEAISLNRLREELGEVRAK